MSEKSSFRWESWRALLGALLLLATFNVAQAQPTAPAQPSPSWTDQLSPLSGLHRKDNRDDFLGLRHAAKSRQPAIVSDTALSIMLYLLWAVIALSAAAIQTLATSLLNQHQAAIAALTPDQQALITEAVQVGTAAATAALIKKGS